MEIRNDFVLKKAIDKACLKREFQALTDCRSRYVQEVSSINEKNNQLELIYYHQAKALIKLSSNEVSNFPFILLNIIRALSHCHFSGWVHGDIKPSNILYFPTNLDIVLIDFAAALPLGSSRNHLANWQYSKGYCLNEQQRGSGIVEAKSDWFAVKQILNQIIRHVSHETYKKHFQQIDSWLISKIH